MIRVLSIDNPNADGISWWRNIRPLTELQRAHGDIDVKFMGENVPLADLLAADIVIFYRPVTPKSLGFIEQCKTLGKKVIIDIDDNLWRLPPGHPSEADYNEHAQTLAKIYAHADGIWCSTDPIMDFADARDGRGVVVANAVLPEDLPDKPSPYRGFVCWRGSQSQHADIENEDSKALFEKNADRFQRWFFWGYHPASMRAANAKGLKRVGLVEYIFGLSIQGINLMWKPLQENQFNDAKSNIAWIEATLAGAVCVTNYAHKPGWEMAIDHFTDNADFIASQWQASKDWIIEHYNLRKVNEIRYTHILKVLGA
jgi:hypothetical protein